MLILWYALNAWCRRYCSATESLLHVRTHAHCQPAHVCIACSECEAYVLSRERERERERRIQSCLFEPHNQIHFCEKIHCLYIIHGNLMLIHSLAWWGWEVCALLCIVLWEGLYSRGKSCFPQKGGFHLLI